MTKEDFNLLLQIIDATMTRGGIIPPDSMLSVAILRSKVQQAANQQAEAETNEQQMIIE
jgi:hypothetical protein